MKKLSLNTKEKSAAVLHEQARVVAEKQTEILLSGSAEKIGKRAQGRVYYQIFTDIDRQEISVAITGNDSGGYFSREAIPFRDIEACLGTHAESKGFPTKIFRGVFASRSVNNAGFLAAILTALRLITRAPDSDTQYVVSGDPTSFKAALLANSVVALEVNDTAVSQTQAIRASPLAEAKVQRGTLSLKKGARPSNENPTQEASDNAQN